MFESNDSETTIKEKLKKDSIILAYRGSIAHGMYMPNTDPNSIDDIDLMSICVPSIDHYFGLRQYGSRGTKEIKKDKWDVVIYEFLKFVGLLENGNPNVLSLLWLEPQHYIHLTDEGKYLIKHRHLFANKYIYHSFSGYARAQLYKMTHLAFEGYMGDKRKKLVEQYGYDTKNAAHLIRLLRMSIEFLTDGELRVLRNDAQELLSIKRGEWSLDKVKAEADVLFILASEAFIKSPLPLKPDLDAINKLCVEILEGHFK